MELLDIQQQTRNKLGLNIEPEMGAYVLRVLSSADPTQAPPAQIPVIGADARTGVALRMLVPVESFNAVQP